MFNLSGLFAGSEFVAELFRKSNQSALAQNLQVQKLADVHTFTPLTSVFGASSLHTTPHPPLATMRPPTSSAGSALRSWTKHPLPGTRIASAVAVQQRSAASVTSGEVGRTTSFDSPFRTSEPQPSTAKIPSFKSYMSNRPEVTNRVFQYFVVGSMGLLAAAGAKATVQGASRCTWMGLSQDFPLCLHRAKLLT